MPPSTIELRELLAKATADLPWSGKIEPISYPECDDQDLPFVIRDAAGKNLIEMPERYGPGLDEAYLRDAALIVAAVNSLPSLLDRVEELERAVGQAEHTFRWYAELHAAKATPDGIEKAKRNEELADQMAAALEGRG